MASTALARITDESSAATFLAAESARIAPFLPKGTEYDRVVLTVRLAIRKLPKLLECEPESLLTAVAQIQQWGLEIGTTAHLVPFNTKINGRYVVICTPIADYKGLAELVVASGAARHVEARCVYEKDGFVFKQGLVPVLEHHPVSHYGERGALIGAYVIFRLRFGVPSFEYMPIGEIDAIREKYSKQWTREKVGDCPPWYAMKTVVRQGVKLLPKNPKLASALRVIEQDEERERLAAAEDVPFEIMGQDDDTTAAPAKLESREDLHRTVTQPKKEGLAPATAPNPKKIVSPTSITDEDLAWASSLKLRGGSDKWGGHGGQPMGELDSDWLVRVRDFFAKKRSEKGEADPVLDDQIRAASIILADREREQGTLPLNGDEDDDLEIPF